MKKWVRKIALFLIAICMVMFCKNNVYANEVSKDNLSVSISTDKQIYNSGDTISCTLNLKNDGNTEIKNIKIKEILPTNYFVEGKYENEIKNLKPGDSKNIIVNCLYDNKNILNTSQKNNTLGQALSKSNISNTNNTTNTGDKNSVLKICLLVFLFLVGIVLIIYILKKKRYKKITALIICLSMLLGTLFSDNFVQAATNNQNINKIKAQEDITVSGKEEQIAFEITYEISESDATNDKKNDESDKKDDNSVLTGTIKFDNVNDGILQTTNEKYTVSGSVDCDAEITKISCELKSEVNNKVRNIPVNGTKEWKITDVPLDIGTNYLKVIAYDKKSNQLSNNITIIRNSKTVKAADNVISFDIDNMQEIAATYENIIGYWVDDNGTEDTNDDIINIGVTNENPLYKNIINCSIKTGDIIYMPANDYFVSGFTYIYDTHDDNEGNHIEGYDSQKDEIIHVKNASFMDLFDDDISINSTSLDVNNPIAFTYSPYNNETVSEYSSESAVEDTHNTVYRSSSSENPKFNFGESKQVARKGFQPQNLAKILPKADLSQIQSGKVQLTIPDIILYDKDGDPDNHVTEYDRVCVGGNITISDLKPTVGLEWHPTLNKPLPNQFITTLEYKQTTSAKVTVGGDIVSLNDIVKECNGDFENKQNVMGMTFSGINAEDTIFIGCIGLQVGTPVTIGGIKTISNKSKTTSFNPILLLSFNLDLEGNITASVSAELKQTSYIKKGFNLQQKNFVGAYGTEEQNKGTENYEVKVPLVPDYDVNVYNVKAKSKDELTKKPETILNILGEGQVGFYLGIGVGAGIMMCGIMPAMLSGSIGPSGNIDGYGQITFSNYEHDNSIKIGNCYCTFDANIEAKLEIIAKAKLKISLKAKTCFGSPGFDFNRELARLTIFSAGASTVSIDGYIYKSDIDDDNTNNEPIKDAEVTLTKNNDILGNKYTVKTDSTGYYKISGLSTTSGTVNNSGKYTLEISKDGFDNYKNDNFKVVTSTSGHTSVEDYFNTKYNYYLDSNIKTSSIEGNVTKADNDTDMTNNEPLKNAMITLEKIGSSTFDPEEKDENGNYKHKVYTNDSGYYKLSNLATGKYKITVKKYDYLTVSSIITVSENESRNFNVIMEAISASDSGIGKAQGNIKNALNGQNINQSFHLIIYKGYNNVGSEAVKDMMSNPDGSYEVSLDAGIYTVLVRDESDDANYFDDTFNIKILGNSTIHNQDFTLTPKLNDGEVRVVLTWGEYPLDLDSHMVTSSDDNNFLHTWYRNKNAYSNVNSNNEKVMNLDVDDTDSYGPETTSIYYPAGKTYDFYVHNYSDRYEQNSTTLGNSGAVVKVYVAGQKEAKIFNVPNQDGTLWKVFSYDSETKNIIGLNEMTYESNPSQIGNERNLNDIELYSISEEDIEK